MTVKFDGFCLLKIYMLFLCTFSSECILSQTKIAESRMSNSVFAPYAIGEPVQTSTHGYV